MHLIHHVLSSESRLPPGSYFIDPYDNTRYDTHPDESLPDLVDRIRADRTIKNRPQPTIQEWKAIITEFIYDTTPDMVKPSYFTKKEVAPGLSHLLTFAKTVTTQLLGGKAVSIQQRQERARGYCLNNCALHKQSSNWVGNAANKISDKVTKTGESQKNTLVKSYPEEERLGTCGMCGCGLANKLKFSAEAAFASLKPEYIDELLRVYGFHAFTKCWIMKECFENPQMLQPLRDKLASSKENGLVHLNTHEATQLAIRQAAKQEGSDGA